MLTGAECIMQYRRFPHLAHMLAMQNNHRIQSVNRVLAKLARAEGMLVLDAFFVTLAAGCSQSADILHFRPPVYRAEATALFALLETKRFAHVIPHRS